jgi:cation transport ATPase
MPYSDRVMARPAANRAALVVLIACLLVTIACIGYPLYVMRPFHAQDGRQLTAALALMRWRMWVLLLCSAVSVWAAGRYWHTAGKSAVRRRLAVSGALVVCALTALSFINVFEMLFHPDGKPTFTVARLAKLEGDEKVIAVRIGSSARAYPVRVMAYHHVLNDVVGGVPLTATY